MQTGQFGKYPNRKPHRGENLLTTLGYETISPYMATPNKSHLSERFATLLRRSGKSQTDVAELMGVRKGTVSKLIHGQQGWTEEMIRKASVALGVSISQLWGDIDYQPPPDKYTFVVVIPKEWRTKWDRLLDEEMRQRDPGGLLLKLIRAQLFPRSERE